MSENNNNGKDKHTVFQQNYCILTGKKQSLDEMIDFPCDYTFKVMGKAELLVIEEVVSKMEEIIEREINRDLISMKESSGGKYNSYTIRVFLKEAEELKRIYEYLKTLKDNKTIAYYL